jgi:hypothetical protein
MEIQSMMTVVAQIVGPSLLDGSALVVMPQPRIPVKNAVTVKEKARKFAMTIIIITGTGAVLLAN